MKKEQKEPAKIILTPKQLAEFMDFELEYAAIRGLVESIISSEKALITKRSKWHEAMQVQYGLDFTKHYTVNSKTGELTESE